VSGDITRLERVIDTAESAIVASSGGVDSSLVDLARADFDAIAESVRDAGYGEVDIA
jgi:PP-loop superfamily ATP-utilizing enzyme